MAYFKRTNIFKSILFSRGMALGILLAIVFVSFGLVSLVGKSIDASKARKVAEAQAVDLKVQESDLSTKLTALASPDGEEAALREKYPLVKPGEHVVVITDDATDPVTSDSQPAAPAPSGGFWSFL